MGAWVDSLPDDARSKLLDWDLLDITVSMASKVLTDHIDEWNESILADGRTENHANITKVHSLRIINACKFFKFRDIKAEPVKQYLALQQRSNGISIETRNSHLRAIKQFCKWMVEEERANESPLMGLKMLNAQTDRRRTRRALSITELKKLIKTTKSGPMRGKTSGRERALIYCLACETGLRSSEIRSLNTGSFSLITSPPTVTVEASNSKRRRRDTLSLSSELTTDLRKHLANKLPNAKAFSLPKRSADMLKDDLVRAKIEYVDPDTGAYLDFHSLRVTCATLLALGGASPATSQARMRHSSIELTMNTYTKLGMSGQDEALQALPKFSTGA